MASSIPDFPDRFALDDVMDDPSGIEGIHFNGLFRKEWDVWARAGRLDFKGLRAELPDVVKGLRNGTIDPKEFSECLTWQDMAYARNDIEQIPCVGNRFDFGQQLLIMVTKPWLGDDSHGQLCEMNRRGLLCKKLFEDLHEEMAVAISDGVDADSYTRYRPGYRCRFDTGPGDFRETLYYGVWLYGFHRAVEKNKKALAGLIKQVKDQFPMYFKNTTKREFDSYADNVLSTYADFSSPEFKAFYRRMKPVQLKREHIFNAAQCIATGRDVLEESCWECKIKKSKVFQCGGCKMAYYCCKEHQRKAWTGGHKNSCQLLGEVRKFAEMNLQRIEKAVKGDDILGGRERLLRPCLEIDCLMLEGMIGAYVKIVIRAAELQMMPSLVARSGPPSMENYYRNLADVVNGEECFVFPDAPNRAFKDSSNDGGVRKDENVLEGTKLPGNLLIRSTAFLAGAIGFRPESTGGGEKVMEDNSKLHVVLELDAESNLLRTAREFLNRYRSYHLKPGKRRWKERKTEVLQFTRSYLHDNFHKLPEKAILIL